jgi:hypothetical protein
VDVSVRVGPTALPAIGQVASAYVYLFRCLVFFLRFILLLRGVLFGLMVLRFSYEDVNFYVLYLYFFCLKKIILPPITIIYHNMDVSEYIFSV